MNTYRLDRFGGTPFQGRLLAIANSIPGRDFMLNGHAYHHVKESIDLVGLAAVQGESHLFLQCLKLSALIFPDIFFEHMWTRMTGNVNELSDTIVFKEKIEALGVESYAGASRLPSDFVGLTETHEIDPITVEDLHSDIFYDEED